MTMVTDLKGHEEYWDTYEYTPNGQTTYFGGHSTRTTSLDNMPNGKLLGLRNGAICITSDGNAYTWDKILKEWIPQ